MGIDIDGWIEVSWKSKEERDSENSWFGLMHLLPIIDVCDYGSLRLFGIGRTNENIKPIAYERGIPKYCSTQVKAALSNIDDFIKVEDNCKDDFFGYTNLYYDEVEEIIKSGLGKELEGTQWELVFSIINVLITSDRYKPYQIRLVVWANY